MSMASRWSDYPKLKMMNRNHSRNSSGRSIGILNHLMPPRAKTPSVAPDLQLQGGYQISHAKIIKQIKASLQIVHLPACFYKNLVNSSLSAL